MILTNQEPQWQVFDMKMQSGFRVELKWAPMGDPDGEDAQSVDDSLVLSQSELIKCLARGSLTAEDVPDEIQASLQRQIDHWAPRVINGRDPFVYVVDEHTGFDPKARNGRGGDVINQVRVTFEPPRTPRRTVGTGDRQIVSPFVPVH